MSLRDAAQQALEALETLAHTKGPSVYNSARDALRAALAEPAPEPVHHKHEWFRTGEMKVGQCRCIHCGAWGHEVFSPAPQRQPLSDEQIDAAIAQDRDALLDHIYEYGTEAEGVLERVRKLARALDAARSKT